MLHSGRSLVVLKGIARDPPFVGHARSDSFAWPVIPMALAVSQRRADATPSGTYLIPGMATPAQSTGDTRLQSLINAVRAGDPRARELLIGHASNRVLVLTRRMFRGRPGLQRWEQTDDVFQNAMLRLHRALETTEVETVRHFFNLATIQIRRELIDLGRKHFGPHGIGRNHHTDHQPPDQAGGTLHALESEPSDLAEWTEFHERAQRMPDEEREVFDLLYYEGLSQDEAAAVLGVSVRTIRRRWNDAKFRLHGGLSDGSTDA